MNRNFAQKWPWPIVTTNLCADKRRANNLILWTKIMNWSNFGPDQRTSWSMDGTLIGWRLKSSAWTAISSTRPRPVLFKIGCSGAPRECVLLNVRKSEHEKSLKEFSLSKHKSQCLKTIQQWLRGCALKDRCSPTLHNDSRMYPTLIVVF